MYGLYNYFYYFFKWINMILLSNNKLILNWHRIFDMKQLFEFIERKFKCEIISKNDIEKILKNYKGLIIRKIWNSKTDLKDKKNN